jgi:hypothetical protein
MEKFDVISNEIEILQPDIILFLSGPNYDENINCSIKDLKFNQFVSRYSQRELAKIDYKEFKNIYRTYHPQYLYRKSIINDIFLEIIQNIEMNR